MIVNFPAGHPPYLERESVDGEGFCVEAFFTGNGQQETLAREPCAL